MELFPEWVFLASWAHGAIQVPRDMILSLPRDWVLARIEQEAEPFLRDGTYDAAGGSSRGIVVFNAENAVGALGPVGSLCPNTGLPGVGQLPQMICLNDRLSNLLTNIRTDQTYRTSVNGVYACGDARIGQSLIVTAIAEGRKCARIVNRDLGGSPMDADREMLAVGAWSGEADRTLRHEAEAAGTVRPGEEFFSGPGTRRV